MSRKTSLAVIILVLSILTAVQFVDWSFLGERNAVQPARTSTPLATAPSQAAGSQPPLTAQGFSPAPAEPGRGIRVSNGLLSLSVKNQALGWVLEEIGRQSGIAFHVADEIAARPISLAVHEVPVEQGLVRILADHDSVHYFGARNSPARGLQAVWVYPRGQGLAAARDHERGAAGKPSGANPAYRSPLQLATDADPAIRLQAISVLAEGGEPGVDQASARAALQTAISDPDPQVRAHALNGLISSDPNAAFTHQVQGLRDADPAVRLMAVGTLTAQGQGLALLQAALNDPDEEVRLAARLQLERNRQK